MRRKKTNRKKNQKKQKPKASKKFTQKARLASEKQPTPESKPAKNKGSRKKKAVRATAAVRRKSQSVETASPKPTGLGTRAGVGAGDVQGISIVENVDSESAEELLEEGQAFEAG